MQKSHIERIYSDPNFKPFKGPDAELVYERVREIAPPFTDERVRRAVESLSALNRLEVEAMIKVQNDFCVRCGNCCRNNNKIDFLKWELKAVAKRFGMSYGKLKRKLNAKWSGRTSIWDVPGKPCPFLEGRNYCTIYDIRPLVCQLYPLGKPLSCMLRGTPVQVIAVKDCPAMKEIFALIAVARLVEEVA